MPRRKLDPQKKMTDMERQQAFEEALSMMYQMGKYFMSGMIEASEEYRRKKSIEQTIKDRDEFKQQ